MKITFKQTSLILAVLFANKAQASHILDQQNTKSKIAIVSLHDENFNEIGKWAHKNKKKYSKKHGYSYYLYKTSLDKTRKPTWSKVIALQNHLAQHQWLYWIDADALIMNYQIKLESIINSASNEYDIIITKDCWGNINAGSYLIRNTPWSHEFLKKMYDPKYVNNPSPWNDNWALMELIKDPAIKKHIKVIDARIMNSYILCKPNAKSHEYYQPGDFVIHFAGLHSQKLNLIKNWTIHRKIINTIGYKDFDQHYQELNDLEKNANIWWSPYYPVLSKFINKHNLKVGCEVGVAFGTHSLYTLKNSSVKKLYSIDPYRHFPQNYADLMNFSQNKFDVLHKKVKSRLKEYGDRSKLIRKTSEEASKDFTNHSLDFVFIDANHSYEAVLKDLNCWYDKIKPNGFMLGDDYDVNNQFPGVKKAVDEFFKQKNIKLNLDTTSRRIWWIQKP